MNGKHLRTVENVKIKPDIGETTVTLGHFYFDNKPMIGKIIDINVWGRYLTEQESLLYSNCENYIEKQGDIINKTTQYNITGSLIKQISVEVEDFSCRLESRRITLYVHKPFNSFWDAKQSCDKYLSNSIIGPFTDIENDWRKFHSQGKENIAVQKYCWHGGRFIQWMPYEDQSGNGTSFVHAGTNKSLDNELTPWISGYPRTSRGSCIVAYLGKYNFDTSWRNWDCKQSNIQWGGCVACWLPNTPNSSVIIYLRGLCKRSKLDQEYQVRNGKNGLITYIGKKSTVIQYNEGKRQWMMRNVNNVNVSAVTDASMASFVMGTYQWKVSGHTNCNKKETKMMLTLTTCNDGQFTCANGLCVAIESRCDGRNHCPDKSDEIDCRKISEDVSYQKHFPPSKEHEQLKVEVSVDILKIKEVNEIDSIFHVRFYLYLTWHDTRLRFENLKKDNKLNALTPSEKEQIWYPAIYLKNTEDNLKILADQKATIFIEQKGNFTTAKNIEYENKLYYKGSENPITYFRYFSVKFDCEYEMKYYPFDIQVCQLILSMPQDSQNAITMKTGILKYLGNRNLQQYVVRDFSMKVRKTKSQTLLEINLTLGRGILGIFLTVLFPTLILNFISYITNFFKAFKMDIIKVNLTAMLVLATIFRSVCKNLYYILILLS